VEVKLTFWARLRYLLGNSLQVETAILVEHAPGKLQSHSVARVVKAAPKPTQAEILARDGIMDKDEARRREGVKNSLSA